MNSRKKALLLANIPALLGAALMGLSRLCGSFEMIIAGRLFSGVCGGKFAFLPVVLNSGKDSDRGSQGFTSLSKRITDVLLHSAEDMITECIFN